jgi:hypothetical protein
MWDEKAQTMNRYGVTTFSLILVKEVCHFLDWFIMASICACKSSSINLPYPYNPVNILPRITKTPIVFSSTYCIAFFGSSLYMLSTEMGISLHSTSKYLANFSRAT